MAESNQREINISGRIEVSDELCEDGSEALVFITEESDEFVIRNRKVVRRLKKYAYQDPIKIHGMVKRSTDGIDVLGVLGYEVARQDDAMEERDAFMPEIEKKGRKRHRRSRSDDMFVALDENADYIDEKDEALSDDDDDI